MSEPASILVLNGPNLNMLGAREPAIYGRDTLEDIEAACAERAELLGFALDFRQSNIEGEMVTWIQSARTEHDGIVINPGAYGHTSIALLDALLIAELPLVEVHLSNVFRREEFRWHSYVSRAANGVICGLGAQGYLFALDAMARLVERD